jgi:signal transduction histidine kinase
MRRVLLFFVSLSLLLIGQGAYARDNNYIVSQSYYSDKTNALTLSDVQAVSFVSYQGLLIGGFSKGAYWVKLGIRAHTQDLVLKIRPAYTNEITLYDPASTEKPKVTGSRYPLDDADVEATSLNFLLPPSTQDRDVYLRIKSASSYLVYVEAMPLTEFKRTERTENLIYAGYVMLTLILSVWLFMTWLMNRERVIGMFAVQQFFAFLHTFIAVGLARAFLDRYISDALINDFFKLIAVTYPLIGLVANMLLLREYGLKKRFRLVFNILIGASLLVLGLFLSGHDVTALNINAQLVLVMMIYFWVCIFWGTEKSLASESSNAVQLNVLRLFYSFNLLVWLIAVLPLLGVVSTGAIALHSLFVYNMMSSLVFFFLLQYRARRLLRQEVARAITLKAEATQERQRREEQSMLMAMLSHEIKTPLSILKLVVDEKVAGSDLEGHANRAVSNIDFIVNRCLQLGKLDAEAVQLVSSQIHLPEYLATLVLDQKAQGRVKMACQNLMLHADGEILRVVLSNLLDNALKYSPADSQIELVGEPAEKAGVAGVCITVTSDLGPLGAPDPEQVFKKYYRNMSASKISGSGLGLFLVQQLLTVLGGTVVYSQINRQVRFMVWIPT